ncbi:MAG: hypothetical protein MEQ84_07770 [Mesorhizobium sp.]|nr:hypothetical protein [Mesorhizobium sp.]
MNFLQAAAALTLWRSGRFDTADIAAVLEGVREADVCLVLHTARERERGPDMHVVRAST